VDAAWRDATPCQWVTTTVCQFGITLARLPSMKTRIQNLKQRIRIAATEKPAFLFSEDGPPELDQPFVDPVRAFERYPKRTLWDLLSEAAIELPPPEKLSDTELSAKLWEIIHGLLARFIVMGNTDHLTDRELYVLLWNTTLRQEFLILPRHTIQIDCTKTGAANDMSVYLKYYATEEQRRLYMHAYPDFKMPEHVEPPRRRDHLIPDDPSRVKTKQVS
jgi:hypothetical protein